MTPFEFVKIFDVRKLDPRVGRCYLHDPTSSCFNRTITCDGRTDERMTTAYAAPASIMACGKNVWRQISHIHSKHSVNSPFTSCWLQWSSPTIQQYLWKDERLSWPGWLTCSGRFTHSSGHPSAAGRALDRESFPARDRLTTTVACNQHYYRTQ